MLVTILHTSTNRLLCGALVVVQGAEAAEGAVAGAVGAAGVAKAASRTTRRRSWTCRSVTVQLPHILMGCAVMCQGVLSVAQTRHALHPAFSAQCLNGLLAAHSTDAWLSK